MSRVKRGVPSHHRHKKMLKMAKGYRVLRHRIFTQAKNAVMKAGLNAYRHRKLKKRDFRTLWIARINAATRAAGMQYSRFVYGLMKADVLIDRKILAELAVHNDKVFGKIVEIAKKSL